MSSSNLIKKRLLFYRHCHQANSREPELDDIFDPHGSGKIRDLFFLDEEEFLARGDMPMAPLSPAAGKQLHLTASLYTREFQLLYGVFFVCGHFPAEEVRPPQETVDDALDPAFQKPPESGRVSGPVLYYEAFLEADNDEKTYQISIDFDTPILNKTLLRSILRHNDSSILASAPLPLKGVDDIYLADLLGCVPCSEAV